MLGADVDVLFADAPVLGAYVKNFMKYAVSLCAAEQVVRRGHGEGLSRFPRARRMSFSLCCVIVGGAVGL